MSEPSDDPKPGDGAVVPSRLSEHGRIRIDEGEIRPALAERVEAYRRLLEQGRRWDGGPLPAEDLAELRREEAQDATYRARGRQLRVGKQTRTIAEWAQAQGLTTRAIRYRLEQGRTPAQAIRRTT